MFRTKIITITEQHPGYSTSASSDYFKMRRDFPEKLANALIEFDSRFEIVYNQKATAPSEGAGYTTSANYVSAAVLSHPALGGMYLQIMQPLFDINQKNSYNQLFIGYRRNIPTTVTYDSRGYKREAYVCTFNQVGDLEQSFNVRVATIDDENFLAIGIAGYNASPDTYNFWFLEAENIQDVEPKRKSYGSNGDYADTLQTTYYLSYPKYYLSIVPDEGVNCPVFTARIHVVESSGSATASGYILRHCKVVSSANLIPRRYYELDGERYYSLNTKVLVIAPQGDV